MDYGLGILRLRQPTMLETKRYLVLGSAMVEEPCQSYHTYFGEKMLPLSLHASYNTITEKKKLTR